MVKTFQCEKVVGLCNGEGSEVVICSDTGSGTYSLIKYNLLTGEEILRVQLNESLISIITAMILVVCDV